MESQEPTIFENESNTLTQTQSATNKRVFVVPTVSVPYDVLETTKFFFLADSSGINFNGGSGEV